MSGPDWIDDELKRNPRLRRLVGKRLEEMKEEQDKPPSYSGIDYNEMLPDNSLVVHKARNSEHGIVDGAAIWRMHEKLGLDLGRMLKMLYEYGIFPSWHHLFQAAEASGENIPELANKIIAFWGGTIYPPHIIDAIRNEFEHLLKDKP